MQSKCFNVVRTMLVLKWNFHKIKSAKSVQCSHCDSEYEGFETNFDGIDFVGIFDGALNCWRGVDPLIPRSELGVTGRGNLDRVEGASLLELGVAGNILCVLVVVIIGRTPSFKVSVDSDGVEGKFRLILELWRLPDSETVSGVVGGKTVWLV